MRKRRLLEVCLNRFCFLGAKTRRFGQSGGFSFADLAYSKFLSPVSRRPPLRRGPTKSPLFHHLFKFFRHLRGVSSPQNLRFCGGPFDSIISGESIPGNSFAGSRRPPCGGARRNRRYFIISSNSSAISAAFSSMIRQIKGPLERISAFLAISYWSSR